MNLKKIKIKKTRPHRGNRNPAGGHSSRPVGRDSWARPGSTH